MDIKQEIIIRHTREGKSQRQISRELQISRPTVKKYLIAYNISKKKGGDEPEALHEHLSKKPKYDVSSRTKRVLNAQIQSEINQLLEQNKKKQQEGLHKQLLKKCDILEVLHEKGYKIGYTTVCDYIRVKEKQTREAFIRQQYTAGSVCEFDWGEVKVKLNGQRTTLQLAVFTSAYSNYRYASLYHRQDTLAFMESHVSFFSHTEGVYHQMTYDNMRVAVARFVGKNEKEPTEALSNLKGHYRFHHRFCNAYKGNEKGHVERSVEYIRRKAFAVKDEFTCIDQAREHLCCVVDKLNKTPRQNTDKTSFELFTEEKEILWTAPMPFACYSTEQCRADKYATVSFSGNRYSVPDHLVGEFVDLKIYSNQLKVYYQDRIVGVHQRSYGAHKWVIHLGHYLKTLHKKPGALHSSVALAQSKNYIKEVYAKYYQDSPKDFVELMTYCRKHELDHEALSKAEHQLLELCPTNITTEKLIALLGNAKDQQEEALKNDIQIESASLAHLAQISSLMNN